MSLFRKEHFLYNNEEIRLIKQNSKYSKTHEHEFIEAVYFFSGAGVHIIDNCEYEIKDGSFYFIEIGQKHSIITKDNKADYVDMLIDPGFLRHFGEGMEVFSDLMLYDSGILNKKTIPQTVTFSGANRIVTSEIVREMINEYEHRNKSYERVIRNYFDILVMYIKRNVGISEAKVRFKEIDTVMPEVIDYINKNFSKVIQMHEIADKYHYNPDYFSRAFKSYFNINFLDYLNERKIENAIDMLQYDVYNIDLIAQMSGFSNKTQFYKLFRKKTGKTPNEYRKNLPSM